VTNGFSTQAESARASPAQVQTSSIIAYPTVLAVTLVILIVLLLTDSTIPTLVTPALTGASVPAKHVISSPL